MNMGVPIVALTDDTFDEAIAAATTPVLVDFWARWCGPCKMLEPVIEQLAAEYDGTVQFATLDVDEHPQIARRLEVMSMPTLIVFRGGHAVRRLVGARGRASLSEELEELLA
jgi:thioredoxin 1